MKAGKGASVCIIKTESDNFCYGAEWSLVEGSALFQAEPYDFLLRGRSP